MPTVKTAISVQKTLFDQVNELAEELQMPRSQLFALAVEEFVKRYKNQKMLELLNDVYDDVPDASMDALRDGMRRQHRRLLEGEW